MFLNEPHYLERNNSLRGRLILREVCLSGGRHGRELHFPKGSKDFGRKGFSYFGPALYIKPPKKLKRGHTFVGI